MNRRLKQAALVSVVVFAGAQFIRPERTNPTSEVNRTIQAFVESGSALPAVLDRSCGDCHSNNTVWPAAANVAPLSWVMARAVTEGRTIVNFSEWAAYSPERRQALLAMSCRAASLGKMPGVYTVVRPETRLSAKDIDTICAAARQTDTTASLAGGSR